MSKAGRNEDCSDLSDSADEKRKELKGLSFRNIKRVCFIVAVLPILVLWGCRPAPVVEETVQPEIPEEIKEEPSPYLTYTSTQLISDGYTVEYPREMLVFEYKDGRYVFFFQPEEEVISSDSIYSFSVLVIPKKEKGGKYATLEDVVSVYSGPEGQVEGLTKISDEEAALGGQEARELRYSYQQLVPVTKGGTTPVDAVDYLIVTEGDDNFIALKYSCVSLNPSQNDYFYDKVVRSFQFVR